MNLIIHEPEKFGYLGNISPQSNHDYSEGEQWGRDEIDPDLLMTEVVVTLCVYKGHYFFNQKNQQKSATNQSLVALTRHAQKKALANKAILNVSNILKWIFYRFLLVLQWQEYLRIHGQSTRVIGASRENTSHLGHSKMLQRSQNLPRLKWSWTTLMCQKSIAACSSSSSKERLGVLLRSRPNDVSASSVLPLGGFSSDAQWCIERLHSRCPGVVMVRPEGGAIHTFQWYGGWKKSCTTLDG